MLISLKLVVKGEDQDCNVIMNVSLLGPWWCLSEELTRDSSLFTDISNSLLKKCAREFLHIHLVSWLANNFSCFFARDLVPETI